VLAEGTEAPDFTLPDQEGAPVSLSDQRGSWVVLWWYPEADTPGCTLEGRCFRDLTPGFREAGAVILGVSFDRPEANRSFREKQRFTFPLLSDVDQTVGADYETRRDPSERNASWPKRRTYLIDPQGVIRKAYRVTDIGTHPDEVLADLRRLSGQ
jgi:thioredoxin-dependent peroxiredoxin